MSLSCYWSFQCKKGDYDKACSACQWCTYLFGFVTHNHPTAKTLAGYWLVRESLERICNKSLLLTSEIFKALVNSDVKGDTALWVKCTISIECKTNISSMLTVKRGLDSHMTYLNWINVLIQYFIVPSFIYYSGISLFHKYGQYSLTDL